jgi:hypothetical protein
LTIVLNRQTPGYETSLNTAAALVIYVLVAASERRRELDIGGDTGGRTPARSAIQDRGR